MKDYYVTFTARGVMRIEASDESHAADRVRERVVTGITGYSYLTDDVVVRIGNIETEHA